MAKQPACSSPGHQGNRRKAGGLGIQLCGPVPGGGPFLL